MKKNPKILVIDDDPAVLELAKLNLSYEGYDVTTADTGEKGLKLAEGNRFDLMLTDLHLPDLDGIEIVRKVKESTPEVEVIMISGLGTITDAVEATKAGAFYFIEKPIEFERLQVLIEKALEHRDQADEIRTQAAEISQLRGMLRSRDSYFGIIGSAKPMQDLYEMIERVAESDANILIVGESGTGKELIANAIHCRSLRASRPFVKINCSALPKELIESELFGHTKGAFTGATTDKQGLIGQAAGGSLLLDEIGEMPIELQPKLLRVLQERVYYRLGSEKALEADFRLICATNRDPQQAISDGHLREDLYYRINTIELRVPPLRERSEDIQHLAEHFLRVYAARYQRPARQFSQNAWNALFAHSWPGNVRELQNIVERAVLLCKGETIEVDNLAAGRASAAAPVQPTAEAAAGPASTPARMTLQDFCSSIISLAPLPQTGADPMTLFEQLEGPLVKAALERTRGNKQAAADLLGIYRPRLYNIIRRHQLDERASSGSTAVTES
ncbi:MAG TPA: sigma-54 dependent transcriptional regulator [Blastocatellia bacterium]|nr:sigma-54 dependent transcriptional regulator [Blastocatellia bacterium]